MAEQPQAESVDPSQLLDVDRQILAELRQKRWLR